MGTNASSMIDTQQRKIEKVVNICCTEQRDELQTVRGRIQNIPQKRLRKKKPNPWISPPPLYQPQESDRQGEANNTPDNYCDCMPGISSAEEKNLLISAEPRKFKPRRVSFRKWDMESLDDRSMFTGSYSDTTPGYDQSTESAEDQSGRDGSPGEESRPDSAPSWKLRPAQLRDGTLTFEVCDANFQKRASAPKQSSTPDGWNEWEMGKLDEAVEATAQSYGMQVLLCPSQPRSLSCSREIIFVRASHGACLARVGL